MSEEGKNAIEKGGAKKLQFYFTIKAFIYNAFLSSK